MMRREEDLRALFATAHEEHFDEIYRFFAYRLADSERASELAQDTFLRAWDYARTGKEVRMIRPFLFTVASNLFKNELRGKRTVVSLEAFMEMTGVEPVARDASPEEVAETKLLLRSLERLEESSREVLLMRFFDGLTSKEIAETRGESETAVAVRIHRALKVLKDLHTQ